LLAGTLGLQVPDSLLQYILKLPVNTIVAQARIRVKRPKDLALSCPKSTDDISISTSKPYADMLRKMTDVRPNVYERC
jgi:hypothetical protein